MAGGLGLNPNATVDNSPCSCNFWPSRGVGVTLVAATCGIFKLKILTLITQQNKLPGKLTIQENRLAASRDFSKPRWGVYSPPQISLLVGGYLCPLPKNPITTGPLDLNLWARDDKTPLHSTVVTIFYY